MTGIMSGVVPDASIAPEVCDLPTTEELNIRSYAATPIVLSDGRVYGTL